MPKGNIDQAKKFCTQLLLDMNFKADAKLYTDAIQHFAPYGILL